MGSFHEGLAGLWARLTERRGGVNGNDALSREWNVMESESGKGREAGHPSLVADDVRRRAI